MILLKHMKIVFFQYLHFFIFLYLFVLFKLYFNFILFYCILFDYDYAASGSQVDWWIDVEAERVMVLVDSTLSVIST